MNIEEVNNLLNQTLDQLRQGRLDQAEALLAKADEYSAPVRDRNFLHAVLQYTRGNAAAAILSLDKELSAFPDNGAAAELRRSLSGAALSGHESLESIMRGMRAAIAEKQWAKALGLADKAAFSAPAAEKIHYWRGVCQGQLGRFFEALSSLRLELSRNQEDRETKQELEKLQRALTVRSPLKIPPRRSDWKS